MARTEDFPLINPGEPGAWPYTRGLTRESYQERPWTTQIWAGAGEPSDTYPAAREILAAGADSVAVRLDAAARAGVDSDHPAYRDRAGEGGVALCHAGHVGALCRDLDPARFFWLTGAGAAPVIACVWAAARMSGKPGACFGVSNDPLGEAFAEGGAGVEPWVLRASADLAVWLAQEAPQAIPLTLSGGGERAPVDPAAELAALLLHAAWSAERLPPSLRSRPVARLECGADLVRQIAAFRAARTAFAHRFGTDAALSILAISRESAFASAQPDVNLVRASLQILAAALGGAQILSLAPRDVRQPRMSPASARLAARTLQILAAETGVTRTVDPVGGAEAVERRTQEFAERALALATALEALPPGEAWARLRSAGPPPPDPVVGVSRFVVPTASAASATPLPAAYFEELAALRAARSQDALHESLQGLRRAARGTGNLMPWLVDAAACHATLGELSACLRECQG